MLIVHPDGLCTREVSLHLACADTLTNEGSGPGGDDDDDKLQIEPTGPSPLFCSQPSRRPERPGAVGGHGGRVAGVGTVHQPAGAKCDGPLLQDRQEDSAERAHQSALPR